MSLSSEAFRALLLAMAAVFGLAAQTQALPLAGEWRIRLDVDDAGHRMNWPDQRFEGAVMFLPGSTDQAGYGVKTQGPGKGWLSRPYVYTGPAWYQRDVVIPELWRRKRLTLFLERAHWQTEVWVDGKSFGMENSPSTPHVYDLTSGLTPGRHSVTICVDNTYRIAIGTDGFSISDDTQTNWNGIVGRIELRAQDPIWIESARISTLLAQKAIRVEAAVRNSTGKTMSGELTASVPGLTSERVITPLSVSGGEQKVEFTVPLGSRVKFWDEFEPAVYELNLALAVGPYRSDWRADFGLRDMSTRNKQFLLNGRPVFLRGTVECAIFPLTAYAPMTEEAWDREFRIARSYGLNYFRFHSWTPPEAAFRAADRAGFMLEVELPVWNPKISMGNDKVLTDFMEAEARRILAAYGNHPSFTMFCLGNEPSGDFSFLDKMLGELKQIDKRRLYTFSDDDTGKVPGETSDYLATQITKMGPIRIHDFRGKGRFAAEPGGTDYDFSKHVEIIPVPLIAHELGQWVTYPSYEEIGKYTGVLKPRNLERFKEQFESRSMGDQAKDFQLASGRFSWLVYKEDLETTLRTPNFGGTQVLQLNDFPGEGEALIGLLDSFFDSKGILTPQEFREFFSETVPLLRFSKFVWTAGETFTARAQLAHYGKERLVRAVAEWTARDGNGHLLGSGKLPPANIDVGTVASLGDLKLPLSSIIRATKIRITLRLAGTERRNHWDIWAYPDSRQEPAPADVLITTSLDEAASRKLAGGGKVLLLWPPGKVGENTLNMEFLPVFWSVIWFKNQARSSTTMGILCDPSHPALADFPTDSHSNWQWWELTQAARALILDDTAPGFRPIVQVIDDFHRNHKLGAVFEASVGKGKILVSSLDLVSDLDKRPVARQLKRSLLEYMSSPRFAPANEMEAGLLQSLLELKQ